MNKEKVECIKLIRKIISSKENDIKIKRRGVKMLAQMGKLDRILRLMLLLMKVLNQ